MTLDEVTGEALGEDGAAVSWQPLCSPAGPGGSVLLGWGFSCAWDAPPAAQTRVLKGKD